MIWNKKKDGAENPGAETPAAQTTKAPVLFLQKNWKWMRVKSQRKYKKSHPWRKSGQM